MNSSRRSTVSKGWTIGVGLIAAFVALPLAAIIWLATAPTAGIWAHLASTVLPDYVGNTLLLGLGVSLGVLLIGVPTAWMVSVYEFPGRRLLDWALFLPLAVPTYLIAFVYTDFLDYAGPVQAALRQFFGWQSARDYSFPDVRSMLGGIVVFTLCLYPYVYWLARAAFLSRGARQLEAARLMGEGPLGAFWRVGLPLARPALAAGVLIVWMETVNDIGAVEHFGIQTLTVGLFDVWLHLGNPGAAAQIALILLVLVVLVNLGEYWARGGRQYFTSGDNGPKERRMLSAPAGLACAILLPIPLILGFCIPAGRLAYYAAGRLQTDSLTLFWQLAGNSILLAASASLICVALAIALAYGARLSPRPAVRAGIRLATLGYGIPGAVLALGVMYLITSADLKIADLMDMLSIKPYAFFGGTIAALVIALSIRFLALGYGTIDSGLQRITTNLDDAARILGASRASLVFRVHVPLMRASVLTAAALVFVDTLKELPMTLLLRPFNYETLASHVYQLASDEQLEASSVSALMIILVGIVPAVALSRLSGRS